jgi:Domain of unknown function (DUF4913)
VTASEPEGSRPQPVYRSTEEWVTCHFVPMYRRPLGGEYRWCPEWWKHAEAITRLTALWHSWEALRLQPGTGMATWLRDHLDHQLPVLLGRAGPFAMCSDDEHNDLLPAPVVPAPPGWWDPGQQADPEQDLDAGEPLRLGDRDG